MTNYPIKHFLLTFCLLFATAFCYTQSKSDFNQVKTLSTEETSNATSAFNSPYELNIKRELGILSGAFGVQFAGLAVANKIKPLTLAQIELLTPDDIPSYDRKTVRNFSGKAHATSDIFLFGSMAFPIALMADKNIRKDFLKIGTMASEAFLLNAGLTTLVKGSVQRVRPYAYNPLVSAEEKMSKSTKMSFFSGHTSAVSVLSFFSAKVYTDYHPDSKWKPVIWTAAAVIPATTGYLRYRAGKHFPTDVIVGYGVGAAIGVLIPHLHRSKKKRQFKLSPMATGDAVGLNLHGVF